VLEQEREVRIGSRRVLGVEAFYCVAGKGTWRKCGGENWGGIIKSRGVEWGCGGGGGGVGGGGGGGGVGGGGGGGWCGRLLMGRATRKVKIIFGKHLNRGLGTSIDKISEYCTGHIRVIRKWVCLGGEGSL